MKIKTEHSNIDSFTVVDRIWNRHRVKILIGALVGTVALVAISSALLFTTPSFLMLSLSGVGLVIGGYASYYVIARLFDQIQRIDEEQDFSTVR